MATHSSPIAGGNIAGLADLTGMIVERFGDQVAQLRAGANFILTLSVGQPSALPTLAQFLFWEHGCLFGGITAEEHSNHWQIHYTFLLPGSGWIDVEFSMALETKTLPSIVTEVHAADWHEREIEDLFGIHFENHPRLGDFVLHDQIWHEGIDPMRKTFSAERPQLERKVDLEWQPLLVVGDPGSFAMPVGPVYEGGIGESLHFLLETVGEDVIRAAPRLFYNYRAVEKIAEGRSIPDALLLAERFAATSAFAHSLAFCLAAERIAAVEAPPRAAALRVLLAELERLRHHAGAIAAICESTALAVAAAQASIIEEQLLRASCVFTDHRYLFGLNTPGGLNRDFELEQCKTLLATVDKAESDLRILERRLRLSSSFLDRLEDVGVVIGESARDLNLVGPIGRASAQHCDLRRACSYSGYGRLAFDVPCETEGDGYARLRILFAEATQSARLIHQVADTLEGGPVRVAYEVNHAGAALGWTEAPRGAALHWLRVDERGIVERYRAITPSFNNWLGFHVAAENFAFQDFPIILATFGLSATECDR
ncbi:MAG TPA: NADH-quinone oxidoreductase subunit C [Alloacidobacterium sp.]|nr:NADH-quinone oxidoreductase subunit C [Alloacidobacterium sp.]